MALIRLTGKYAVGRHEFANVDDDMVEVLSQWRWKAKPNGSGSGVYAVRNTKRDGRCVTIRMHRVVLGMSHTDPLDVDHLNHDTLDNRRINLRPATRRQNAANHLTMERNARCQHCGLAFTRLIAMAHAATPLSCDDCIRERAGGMPSSTVRFERCSECGEGFTARRAGTLFCSEACRCRARYKRRGSLCALPTSGALRARDLSLATKI